MAEEFESRIGKGTKASGKLTFRGPVKIEGEAEGEISGDEVMIATGAVVSARISASKVTIAEGAQFDGDCKMPTKKLAA
jgi:cytoskeletal protein CcmA (bactofilin family)